MVADPVNDPRWCGKVKSVRRLTADDIVFELTDQGMANLQLGAAVHFASNPN